MDYFAGLALILLTLVGYSSGSVLGAKRRIAVPGIADLLVVLVLWVGAFATRNSLGKWGAVGTWLLFGLVLGAALAWLRTASYAEAQTLNTSSGPWNAWMGFARKMGNYQSRVWLGLIYFSVVLPFGLGVALLSDPLRIKHVNSNTNWQPKELPLKPSIDEANSQF